MISVQNLPQQLNGSSVNVYVETYLELVVTPKSPGGDFKTLLILSPPWGVGGGTVLK
jgi:hypothetical protein